MIINGLVNDGLMYNESKRLPNRQRELECCCCVEYKHSSNSLRSTRFIHASSVTMKETLQAQSTIEYERLNTLITIMITFHY